MAPIKFQNFKEDEATLSNNPYFKGLKNDFSTLKLKRIRNRSDAMKLISNKEIDLIADDTIAHKDAIAVMNQRQIRNQWTLKYSLSSAN